MRHFFPFPDMESLVSRSLRIRTATLSSTGDGPGITASIPESDTKAAEKWYLGKGKASKFASGFRMILCGWKMWGRYWLDVGSIM